MEKLKSLDLNKYESETYLKLLEMGLSTAYGITENSDVPFGRIYEILDDLENKGLVTLESKNPKKYKAVDPDIGLQALLNEKDKEWREKKEKIKQFIDSLEYKERDKSEVNIVKSKEVYYKKTENNAKNAEEEILTIAKGLTGDKRTKIDEYERELIENGGNVKLIVPLSDSNRETAKMIKEFGAKVRDYPFNGLKLQIIDGEKTLLTIDNPSLPYKRLAIEVKDRNFSKSMKEMFEAVWERATPIDL